MASYKVTIKNSAQKEIRKLPSKELREKVLATIDDLYKDPIAEGSKKIKGSDNIYRIRLGSYRIVYQLYKKELLIIVIRVRDRKEAYRGF